MRVALLHYSFPPVIGGVERVIEKHAQLLASDGHEVTAVCGKGEAPVFNSAWITTAPSNEGLLQLERAIQKQHKSFRSDSQGHFGERPSELFPVRLVAIPEIAASHPLVKSAQEEVSERKSDTRFIALREFLIGELRPLLAGHDVVMIHNVCTMPFHIALTAALWQLSEEIPETRFVCWIHDIAAMNPDYSVPTSAPWDLLRRANPHFEYIAVSELRQRQMVELTGIEASGCQVIPNGLDLVKELGLSQNIERLTNALELLDRDLVLLQPTRLLRRKNVELSLHVLSALEQGGLDACLLITGAPDPHNATSSAYTQRVLSLRSELHLQNDCYFLGELFEVTDEDITSLYRISDALFFPSFQEGFGLPILEAALHRVPAFCADIEPLSALPGAIHFSHDNNPQEIAAMIIHQMQRWPANLPRKAVVRNYAWSVVYRNYLAPLLNRYKESDTHETRDCHCADD